MCLIVVRFLQLFIDGSVVLVVRMGMGWPHRYAFVGLVVVVAEVLMPLQEYDVLAYNSAEGGRVIVEYISVDTTVINVYSMRIKLYET